MTKCGTVPHFRVLFYLFLNFFGGFMTIVIRSTKRSFRTKPSTFFMLLSAIAGCIHLINGTLARILTIGFSIDLTRTSIGLCKLRQFINIIVPGLGITCYWLSTINQFLVTSRSARLR
ncbi:unnamed protein product [Adineta steineri]|uniref:Uncharacterized protein n=2 Tax=Adineta steineri TaxID=433720 RepID=A0A820D554_9BILA|nr:unnamed protein product [Adineta steineri]CAF1491208.1 unnamed protein product [Adineta steineri]CAF1508538.1 unnamed protein product [Adineta steineri]CAF4226876.1 unnamed protein product [Adineta steineri]